MPEGHSVRRRELRERAEVLFRAHRQRLNVVLAGLLATLLAAQALLVVALRLPGAATHMGPRVWAGMGAAAVLGGWLLFLRAVTPWLRRVAVRQTVLARNAERARRALRGYLAELHVANETLAQKNAQVELHGREIFRLFRAASQQAEMLRLAKEAADAANRAKSEFLAHMTHELRTPLTAILGFAELLQDDADPHEHRDAVATIQRHGDYLLQLIDDILDLSRIEAGGVAVERMPCAPRQIAADVAALLRLRAQEKGLALEVTSAPTVPDVIVSDPRRLRQILINLVGNAVKFTEQGSVSVDLRLAEANGISQLEFAVSDSGLGLTTDQRLRLFEPFVQGDRSTSRKFGGSGLGLAISQRLARALGGQITVASAVGQGSQFVLSVPLVAVEEEPTSPPSAVECNSGASYQTAVDLSPPATPSWRFCGRVLLAEDGPDNQRLLNRILTKAGLEVDLVTNGREAVERALAAVGDGRPYDLVLMDMQMPVVDGYKASRRLRAATYTGPIVALTAFAMTGERAKCLASGCNEYLAKPIRRELLLETVGRYLHTSAGEKRPLDPADRLEAYPTGSGILIDTQ